MEILKLDIGKCMLGIGNREQGIGNREQGTGNREQGIGNREQGIGNREQETIKGFHNLEMFAPFASTAVIIKNLKV